MEKNGTSVNFVVVEKTVELYYTEEKLMMNNILNKY